MVVNFDGEWKKEDLFSHLQRKNVFAEQDCASLSLQVHDDTFELFVDVTDDFVITHRAQLNIKEPSGFRAEMLRTLCR
ncbi:hypothetical protein HPB52_022135 [Rhipicephalus sanguineus]|uniref:Uncharacterized protein n=1 Tax=Rhipicephalus sanguineus TaxID=34632 RepID=A0A9D4TBP6_RHISA|nr:hypothetical protein HPB52_022135 [Rhipicephalus sanguineus]